MKKLSFFIFLIFAILFAEYCFAKDFKILRKVHREGKTELWAQILDNDRMVIDNIIIPVKNMELKEIKQKIHENDPTIETGKFIENLISVKEVLKRLYELGYLKQGETLEDLKSVKELLSQEVSK